MKFKLYYQTCIAHFEPGDRYTIKSSLSQFLLSQVMGTEVTFKTKHNICQVTSHTCVNIYCPYVNVSSFMTDNYDTVIFNENYQILSTIRTPYK